MPDALHHFDTISSMLTPEALALARPAVHAEKLRDLRAQSSRWKLASCNHFEAGCDMAEAVVAANQAQIAWRKATDGRLDLITGRVRR